MDPIKRLQYHDGQLLDVSDFTEEQDYHREMRKRHNRSVHTWGIAEGLEVEPAEKKITISPGTAIDKDGQELILLRQETHPADLKSATRYVTARFEYPDDDTPSMVKKDTDGTKMYSRRTIERPPQTARLSCWQSSRWMGRGRSRSIARPGAVR
jgi:hypothetical protein